MENRGFKNKNKYYTIMVTKKNKQVFIIINFFNAINDVIQSNLLAIF